MQDGRDDKSKSTINLAKIMVVMKRSSKGSELHKQGVPRASCLP
jgi:hypothetical protein